MGNQAPKETKEIRALPVKIEVRQSGEEEEKRTISGSIKYNTESAEMRDWWGDTFVEEIAAGAFDESLKTRGVVGLWSHDTAKVLGSTKSGTLRLESTEKELRFELDLPNTTVGNDAWEMIKRGDVDGVSFGMRVTKDKWSQVDRDGKKSTNVPFWMRNCMKFLLLLFRRTQQTKYLSDRSMNIAKDWGS